ncbi:MAG: polysulfide reductase NrfD [Ignavibacteria bacterium]|nr:polysulfide reductase NrfD [Ignavibacteria bacterium]
MSRYSFIKKIILSISWLFVLLGFTSAIYTLIVGLKSWGLNSKVVWGIEIVNFVFWIGVSHSGTLISAVFYLLRQSWRKPIHRVAETMTIITIVISAFFPFLHMGRPWFFYWLFPYPNQMLAYPNFMSAITWDVIAVFSYFILSFLFWIFGILPDLEYVKLKSKIPTKIVGKLKEKIWIGSLDNWIEYRWSYHIFAGVLTFVVVSVHTIVSYDFSTTFLPTWHSTSLPIFFVVGAIYSGLAFILFVSVVLSKFSHFGEEITDEVREKISKLVLSFSYILLYFYVLEVFYSFYSQNFFELQIVQARLSFPFNILNIAMLILLFVLPQLFLFRKLKGKKKIQLLVSGAVIVGMWLERYLLIIPVLAKDFVSGYESFYLPTFTDISLTLGAVGFFVVAFYEISKRVPIIPKNEF